MSRLKLLEMMPKKAVCAEIGVWRGQFSKIILDKTKPEMLHLIDPWVWDLDKSQKIPYNNYIANTKFAKNQKGMDEIYKYVCKKFQHNRRVVIHRQKSENAVILFNDGKFDWIYIDGCHKYEYVKKDLELYYAKVKAGGFITGDDYEWGKQYKLPVKRAVQDFLNDENFDVTLVQILQGQFIIKKNT